MNLTASAWPFSIHFNDNNNIILDAGGDGKHKSWPNVRVMYSVLTSQFVKT